MSQMIKRNKWAFVFLSICSIGIIIWYFAEHQAFKTTTAPRDQRLLNEQEGGDSVLHGKTVAILSDAAVISVADAEGLQQALRQAEPGHVIELADGIYDANAAFHILNKAGTADRPIIIRAKHQGGAVISGYSWFHIEQSSYVVLEGLRFETVTDGEGPKHVVYLDNSSYSRITHNEFAVKQQVKDIARFVHWVAVQGGQANNNRIDHNHFKNKKQLGHYVLIEGEAGAEATGMGDVPQHTRVDYNFFENVLSTDRNGAETMRIGGGSRTVLTHANAIVENNLFYRCDGEIEIISVKSSGVTIRYNTFLENNGTITLRYGNNSEIYGNFFLGNGAKGTGGIRIHGTDHRIYNNYFEGLTGIGHRSAIHIGWGTVDDEPGQTNVYWRTKRAVIAFNTFVNNTRNFSNEWIDNRLSPINITIANNIVVGEAGIYTFIREDTKDQPAGTQWIGNIMYPERKIGINKTADKIRAVDPALSFNGQFYQLSEASVAIGAAVGEWAWLEDDLNGFRRKTIPDVGALEFNPSSEGRTPLTSDRVGPHAR